MDGLLADVREAQAKLRRWAAFDPGIMGYAEALERLEARLVLKPRLIVLGEGNAGKTSLVNLLLDQTLLPVSVLANTRRPLVLRFAQSFVVTAVTPLGRLDLGHGDIEPQHGSSLQRFEVGLPNPRLASFDLVDTPALSTSVQLDPLQLGAADLLLWCTVATQAWKESERRLWMTIGKRHHRRAILVATHIDNLRSDDDRNKIRARLTAETADCFASIALVCASGRGGSLRSEDSDAAELDTLIANSLSTMARQRRRAGYRLANYIVAQALKRMEAGRDMSAPEVHGLALRR
jgi:Dynamin family